MEKLTAVLKVVLADTFVMYFRAHSYHWNVEGSSFSEMHNFFGSLYEELHDAVDPIAEELRVLDEYAPMSLMELYNYKTLQEDGAKPITTRDMLLNVLASNNTLLANLNKAFDIASEAKAQGHADFLAARIDIHMKHGWMIKSYLKNVGA
jgi:starvation-inducible DNA-binding protein